MRDPLWRGGGGSDQEGEGGEASGNARSSCKAFRSVGEGEPLTIRGIPPQDEAGERGLTGNSGQDGEEVTAHSPH